MNKKNLILIFDHPLSFRSYLETGLLDKLNQIFELKICIIGKFDYDIKVLVNKFTEFKLIQLSLIENFILGFYSNCYWWGVADRSLSIQNRTWFQKKSKKNFINANKLAKVYSIFFSNPPIKFSTILLKAKLSKIKSMMDIENDTKILYITSGGTNSMADQLVSFFSKLSLDVYCIVENWDNISSKAVFANSPKKTGVWGKQSKKYAKEIHNLTEDQVFEIGNPRVEWLQEHVKRIGFPRDIFFGGGSVDFAQESIYLVTAIEIAQMYGAKVYYLPHPKCYDLARNYVKTINSNNLVCVGDFNSKKPQVISKLPSLSTYLEPFNNAKIFISSFSTLNLEAVILGIPSIAIDLRTHMNLSSNKISDRHDHINDISKSNIFNIVDNLENFRKITIKLMSQSQPKLDLDSRTLSYLVNLDDRYLDKIILFLNS